MHWSKTMNKTFNIELLMFKLSWLAKVKLLVIVFSTKNEYKKWSEDLLKNLYKKPKNLTLRSETLLSGHGEFMGSEKLGL